MSTVISVRVGIKRKGSGRRIILHGKNRESSNDGYAVIDAELATILGKIGRGGRLCAGATWIHVYSHT